VGGWRRLLNEELHNLYSPPDIVRVIKSTEWWKGRYTKQHGENDRFWPSEFGCTSLSKITILFIF